MEKIPCTPSIGADVEWLLFDNVKGELVPACGLVGGTKEEPLDLGDGYAVQEDNVMIEWNVPAAQGWDTFYHSIPEIKERVQDHLHESHGDRYTMVCRNEHTFRPVDLQSPQAKTFGCEPDFDAYLGGVQRQDGAGAVLGRTRTCGGHIHLGGDFKCPDFVAALFAELFIGLFAELPMDFSTVRQKWYGQPGIFRPKPYGIEYRTPDNQWTSSQDTVEYTSLYAMRCAEFLTNTPADQLQRMFRQFPWVKLREYMSNHDRSRKTRNDMVLLSRDLGIDI